MNRLLVASAIVVGALATATPAVAGLAGNPSFSHKLPVRVPSSGQVVQFDDHGQEVSDNRGSQSSRPSATSISTHEAGDDNGGASTSRSAEPGDDNGGASTSRSAEPGDDHGSDANTATAAPTSSGQPTDDHGGSGHGSGK
ncbi:MAG: hypothetical protein ABI418_01810 [Jatrophihabitantaceae bacterium]